MSPNKLYAAWVKARKKYWDQIEISPFGEEVVFLRNAAYDAALKFYEATGRWTKEKL
jgi:hypothetical protein